MIHVSRRELCVVQVMTIAMLCSIVFFSPIASYYLTEFLLTIFLNGSLANFVSVAITQGIPFVVVMMVGVRTMNELESKLASRDAS